MKSLQQKNGFRTNDQVVYPAHGVGRIVAIEEGEFADSTLELFVISFEKDKMTVRVPTEKSDQIGMRKLSGDTVVSKALTTLKGKARVERSIMWNRRAPEYEAKINSGSLLLIAEVVRDLYRSENRPEQPYFERQIFESARDRMSREVAAVRNLDEFEAISMIDDILSKTGASAQAAA